MPITTWSRAYFATSDRTPAAAEHMGLPPRPDDHLSLPLSPVAWKRIIPPLQQVAVSWDILPVERPDYSGFWAHDSRATSEGGQSLHFWSSVARATSTVLTALVSSPQNGSRYATVSAAQELTKTRVLPTLVATCQKRRRHRRGCLECKFGVPCCFAADFFVDVIETLQSLRLRSSRLECRGLPRPAPVHTAVQI